MAAGILGGAAVGIFAPELGRALAPLSNVFLRLIQSIIAPLLFAVLVSGIARAGSIRDMGRVGLKAVVYFEIVTTIALLTGWGFATAFQPGAGVEIAGAGPAAPAANFREALENAFPASILDAMARGNILQIVVFCFLFGAAANAAGARAEPMVRFAEAGADIAFRYLHYVMWIAPLGVGAALASTLAASGFSVLAALGRYVAVSYAAQAAFLALVLGGLLAVLRVDLKRFAAAVREPFFIAFATTSSGAALPQALENLEAFGVPRRILSVVLPLGLSFNLDGSVIHLALASTFVAQAAGIALDAPRTLLLLATLKLTSKGVAGIPRAGMVILASLFTMLGLPLESLALLLAVDAIVDMIRTSTNILGNCVAAVVIDRWERPAAPPAGGAGRRTP
jgi:proton glutamate symport protein